MTTDHRQHEIQRTIQPIVEAAYGKGGMVDGLADHLALKIDTYDASTRHSREEMVMHICWDWMTGGTTASSVAKKIEAALATPPGQEGRSDG